MKNSKNEKNKGAALRPKNQYFRDISAGLSPSAEMMNFLNNKSYVIYKNMRFSDHVNLKNKKSKKAGSPMATTFALVTLAQQYLRM